mgnify:CR=1 FL=1
MSNSLFLKQDIKPVIETAQPFTSRSGIPKISPRECDSCKQITTLKNPKNQKVLFLCESCRIKYENKNFLK